jgi:hypothetical protein
VKKYLLLSVLVIAFFALSLGTANAVWKIGGTGPFLNYPFYMEGAYDSVTFKTYLVVNNTSQFESPEIIALVHYVTSDTNLDGVIDLSDLKSDNVNSEFKIHTISLTQKESKIFVPGTTSPPPPGLGPAVTIWPDSSYKVGWVEMWGIDTESSTPLPLECDTFIRGEGITLDLGSASAWTYKAVASVTDPNGMTSDAIGDCQQTGNNERDVVFDDDWLVTYEVPTQYNHLASAYNLDLWVRSPNNPNSPNNTIVILTNPNHRKQAGSNNTCRDCTIVNFDFYAADEDDAHPSFPLCEMRVVSIKDVPEVAGLLDPPSVFYGWAELIESDSNNNDSQAGEGCHWGFELDSDCGYIDPVKPHFCCDPTETPITLCIAGCIGVPACIASCLTNSNNACPNSPDENNCKSCDLDNDGFLAVAFTSWQGMGGGVGITYWGNNLFNNCGDATGWDDFASPYDTGCPGD